MTDNLNRLMLSIRKIIRSEFPNYKFMGTYEYSIQNVSGRLVDADPTDTSIGLPSIGKLSIQPSTFGEEVTPTVGKLILVIFINGDQRRPVITSCQGNNKNISVDADESISIGGGPPAARVNDTILAGGFLAGTITSGSTKTTIG